MSQGTPHDSGEVDQQLGRSFLLADSPRSSLSPVHLVKPHHRQRHAARIMAEGGAGAGALQGGQCLH